MRRKLSLSAAALIKAVGWERALEVLAESGYEGIDFSLGSFDYANCDVDEEYLRKFKAKADSLGIAIQQTHGHLGRNPLGKLLWSQDEESKEYFVKIRERDLRATAILGAEMCVIHSGSEGPFGPLSSDPEELHKANLDGFTSIVPFAEKYNVKICLESFGRNARDGVQLFSWPEEMLKSYEAIPTKNKCFCMDTGHTHEAVEFGTPSVEDFIRAMGSRIECLHIHDNFGYYDDHALPGFGNINWPEVFKALDEVGYKGYYNFELGYARMGCMIEEFVRFSGKYLRTFLDMDGDLRKGM